MENNSTIEILRVLYKKRKPILIITSLAAAVSIILSMPFIMKPMYKSSAVVYPANIGPVSEESPSEQLMQFLSSTEIKDILGKELNLAAHYELDTTDPKFDYYYTLMFNERVSLSQTKYESIQIDVTDEDPAFAQKLAYGVIDAANKLIRKSRNEITQELADMHLSYMETKKMKLDSITQTLTKMSKDYASLDFFYKMLPQNPDIQSGSFLAYLTQVEKATTNNYSILPGNEKAKLQDAMAELGKKGLLYNFLNEKHKAETGDYYEAYVLREKCLRDIKKKFTYTMLVEKPSLPVNKSGPKRSMFVLMGTLGAFVFSALFYVYNDKFKQLKEQIVKE
jgi:capsular polysaccharide biosynthesis protein